jgi:hypothetical protein
MKLKELWKLKIGKFLYIWLVFMIIYVISILLIKDIFLLLVLYFLAFSIFTIPLWYVGYYLLNKKVAITRQGKHIPNFKHGRIFEYIFFSFLFIASFLGTGFYANTVNVLYTGIIITIFTVNALISGYFHYILHFHD